MTDQRQDDAHQHAKDKRVWDTYDHGIVRVKVPVPFPLKWVNGYILIGENACTIIDPGLHTGNAEIVWQTVLRELQIEPGKIEKVVLTHHHPDHYGMAGWMQELTGCEVCMSREGHELALRMWGEGETMTEALCGLFARHGLTEDKQREMREHMRGFIPLVSPQPSVRYLAEGDVWQAGRLRFRTETVSGHAYRHLVFIEEEKRLMFCGDHVLPRITPNISFLPDEDPDPLDSFLQGLEKLSRHDAALVFPGHRDPFTDLRGRASALRQHHEERLEAMMKRLDEPSTAYEVCRAVFGDELSIHQLRFAMSETIAHLVYLHRRGKVGMDETGKLIRFVRVRAG
jgi:glyoxylase-like metal-dependent hydrolase (beta-lactamase superfamily II)